MLMKMNLFKNYKVGLNVLKKWVRENKLPIKGFQYEEFSKETVLSLLKNTKISVKNQKNTILSKENSNGIIERD